MTWKGGLWVFEMRPVICKTVEWMKILLWSPVTGSSINKTLNLGTLSSLLRKLTDHQSTYWSASAYGCPHVHRAHWRALKWDPMDHCSLSCCPMFYLEIRQVWPHLPSLLLGRQAVPSPYGLWFVFPDTEVLQCTSTVMPAEWPWTCGQLTHHTTFLQREMITENLTWKLTPYSASHLRKRKQR